MESNNEGKIQELATAFQQFIPILAGTIGMKQTRFLTGNVTSVDENNRTCNITGILDNTDVSYSDVNLSTERNDGIITFPAIDSTVLVAKMPDGELYVVSYSDITKWLCFIDSSNKLEADSNGFIFNGGALGGLAKIISLTTKLNNLENAFNTHITAYNLHFHAGVTAGVGVTGITTPDTQILTPTIQADIEDTKVKH